VQFGQSHRMMSFSCREGARQHAGALVVDAAGAVGQFAPCGLLPVKTLEGANPVKTLEGAEGSAMAGAPPPSSR